MTSCVVGVFCSKGSALLAEVKEGQPLLRVTLKRCGAAGSPVWALVPWTPDLDHLAEMVKEWGLMRRTHPEERIAMRDLVAEHQADIGILVQGEHADIDVAEIRLARARLASEKWDDYTSPRIKAFPAARWLQVTDSTEWAPPMDTAALQRHYRFNPLDGSTREALARRATGSSAPE